MTAPAPAPAPSHSRHSLHSFRQIPPAIYLALAANLGGTLTSVTATLLASGDRGERFMAVRRWYLFDAGCDGAAIILLALGLAQLARRLTGRARALTLAGAYLGLVSLTWIAIRPALAILDAGHQTERRVYEWGGGVTKVFVETLAPPVPLVVFGQMLGTFCVLDTVPRRWTEDEVHILEDLVHRLQMRMSFEDIGADVVKTGMLADGETIESVADVMASVITDLVKRGAWRARLSRPEGSRPAGEREALA